MNFQERCAELEAIIQAAYEESVTMPEAEKLAALFLKAQMECATQLQALSLDARMRKTGVKSIRAAIYLDTIQKADKRPTEAQVAAMVDSNPLVEGEQKRFDEAEVECETVKRYYDIFVNAHIYYRGIAKGTFGG